MTSRSPLEALSVVFTLITAAACAGDIPTTASLSPESRIAQARAVSCPASPTVVVSDEATLHAAIAAAQPGDVIAIQGMIAIHAPATIQTPDVTLTCATPGSGLTFAPVGVEDFTLVWADADRVAVRALVLDAAPDGQAVFSAFTDGHRTEGNTILCGHTCGFYVSTTNAVVSDNDATQAAGGTTGFHFQSGIDGTRIERNTITALGPTGAPVFGGIRPRDGAGVIVSRNVIRGPWSISISSVNLNHSDLSHNTLEGARRHGIAINVAGSPSVVFSRDNQLIANTIRSAGISGIQVRNACSNQFLANRVLGTPVAVALETTTGDNLVAGTFGLIVDVGAHDCDGDGEIDPNRVNGNATVVGTGSAAVVATSGSARMAGVQASANVSSRRIPMPEKQ